jgi:exodeoxyribonuclease X
MQPSPQPAARRLSETRFAFVDVETTGFDPLADAVVEVACVVTCGQRELDAFSSLVDPQRGIPATASAVHHLTCADVAGAPTLATLADALRSRCADAVVVAHNARFDLAFLPMLADRPALCAMRFAQLVLPDAPNYKNQVLRYHLGIADARLAASAAHRALGDAIVTSQVFARCLARYFAAGGSDDVACLAAALAAPIEFEAFRFGKHRGEPLRDVPSDYLRWIETSATRTSGDARYSARRELERRAHRAAS